LVLVLITLAKLDENFNFASMFGKNSTFQVAGARGVHTLPIASLYWELFTFSPADYGSSPNRFALLGIIRIQSCGLWLVSLSQNRFGYSRLVFRI